MSRNISQKKGLALGSIFALIVSLFGALPAQAAATEGSNIAIRPVAGTTFGGVVYNEFDLYAQLLPGQTNDAFSTSLEWKIEVTSGIDMDVMYHVDSSAITAVDQDTDSSSPGTIPVIAATPTASLASASVAAFGASTVSSGVSYLTVKAHSTSGALTWSQVTLKITAWIDEITVGDGVTTGDGVRDADEWYTEETVTLYNASGLPWTANWSAPNALDQHVTASATITGVNFTNIGNGKFFLAVSSSEALLFGPSVAQQESSSPLAGSVLAARSGVISSSWAINQISESQSVSFNLRYDPAGTGGTYTAGNSIGVSTSYAAVAPGIDTLTMSATANANVSGSGQAYTVRGNQTYTFKVFAATGSTSVSKNVTVTIGGTALVTSSTLVSINGGAFVTAYPAAGITVATGTDGYGTFTVGTSGFIQDEYFTLRANVGNVQSDLVTVTVKDPTYIVDSAYDIYVTKPGTAVAIAYTVNDQWGESSAVSNHYLKVTRGGTGFAYATTVSYLAVTAGTATLNFTPEAATKTGSATVQVQVVKRVNGAYVNDGNAKSVTVNVSATADAFSTGLAASYSASISYFPSTVSWTTVTAKVANTGSAVVVTGDGLVFRQSSAVPATTSGTITVRGDGSLNYTFDVASLLEGSFTMTLTTGGTSTTSLLVVDAAAHNAGASIDFDTTEIAAGRTKIVTGTVKDANGNPVATGDTASILVTYAGTAGIPVGSMPTSTDADGNFKVSILTSAADNGTITLTAVYSKNGASTATAQKITKVQTITVGAGTSASSDDQKVNAGSFKGYVAVYAKGYEGQRLSAKVGNDWVVVPALASNFVRVVEFTGAGYTIAVRIYIDRVLVDTITVTTK